MIIKKNCDYCSPNYQIECRDYFNLQISSSVLWLALIRKLYIGTTKKKKDLDYPPRLKELHIKVDYINQRALASFSSGLEKDRTYIRRYDKVVHSLFIFSLFLTFCLVSSNREQKQEYAIFGGEYPECRRSYLGETMPFPDFPTDWIFVEEYSRGGLTLYKCKLELPQVIFVTEIERYYKSASPLSISFSVLIPLFIDYEHIND